MTTYAPSDINSITISAENGGCGRQHSAPAYRNPGERMSITCPPCEAWLQAHPSLGWSTVLRKVSPTCDERAALEGDTATTDQAISSLMGVFARLAGHNTAAALPSSSARVVESVTAPAAEPETATESTTEGTTTVAAPGGFGDFSDDQLAAVEARIARERQLRKLLTEPVSA